MTIDASRFSLEGKVALIVAVQETSSCHSQSFRSGRSDCALDQPQD